MMPNVRMSGEPAIINHLFKGDFAFKPLSKDSLHGPLARLDLCLFQRPTFECASCSYFNKPLLAPPVTDKMGLDEGVCPLFFADWALAVCVLLHSVRLPCPAVRLRVFFPLP